jgi:hypothetical protein
VLSRLDGVRPSRRGWSARCPAHTDTSPSLSVARGLGGRVLLRCFAGCNYSEILTALGLEPTAKTTARTARSTFALAMSLARRQKWYREETRVIYLISDSIRRRRRAVLVARSIAAIAGDRPQTWRLLATAIVVERDADQIEAELDEILR